MNQISRFSLILYTAAQPMEPTKTFLLVVFAGVFARLFSVLVDGTPSWPFLLFFVGEMLVGIVIGFDVWHRRATHA